MIVISEVAGLARQLESEGIDQLTDTRCDAIHGSVFNWDYRGFDGLNDEEGKGSDDEGLAIPDNTAQPDLDSGEESAAYSRVLTASEKFRIAKMLEGWEEPQEDQKVVSKFCIALAVLDAFADSLRRMQSQFKGFCNLSRV